MSNIIYVSGIPVTVEYRRVKNINLYIMPPDGQVLVTAPKRIPMDTICGFVEKKSGWIEKNRVRIQEASRQKETEVQRVLSPKQQRSLEEKIRFYAEKWQPVLGVHAGGFTLRSMKTRWGSCTVHTGKIRINTRLAFYPEECLEYVVVHELCHLIEPAHNRRFYECVERCLPDWKLRRQQLAEKGEGTEASENSPGEIISG